MYNSKILRWINVLMHFLWAKRCVNSQAWKEHCASFKLSLHRLQLQYIGYWSSASIFFILILPPWSTKNFRTTCVNRDVNGFTHDGRRTSSLLQLINNGDARNFHLGAIAQGVWGTEIPQWGPGRPRNWINCRHCLQILTAETIKIWRFHIFAS